MKIKAVFCITELGGQWIEEHFEGTLEECLTWKSTKINEFTDFVGFEYLDACGYRAVLDLGDGRRCLVNSAEHEQYDVLITDKTAKGFLSIFMEPDHGN